MLPPIPVNQQTFFNLFAWFLRANELGLRTRQTTHVHRKLKVKGVGGWGVVYCFPSLSLGVAGVLGGILCSKLVSGGGLLCRSIYAQTFSLTYSPGGALMMSSIT